MISLIRTRPFFPKKQLTPNIVKINDLPKSRKRRREKRRKHMLKTFTNKDNPMVFNVNAYLLINEESHQAILIDTAMMGEAIIQFIYENNLVLTDIFITHFHFDHIATLDMLQKELHPKIHIGQKDLAFLFNPETNGTARTGVKFGLVQDDNFVAITAENEVTIDGFTIKAIPFGGHTPGTTFYVVNDEYAFVGDTLFKDKIGFHTKNRDGMMLCDDERFFLSLDYIVDNFSNYLICPGHHEELFRVSEVISNPDHPYHSMRD
jgi:hydroxyacylglutathione hydrolase